MATASQMIRAIMDVVVPGAIIKQQATVNCLLHALLVCISVVAISLLAVMSKIELLK